MSSPTAASGPARPGIALEVTNLVKEYPGVRALNGVSLALRPGEVHAIIGENGAGKSTLIKTLAGAIRPTSGTISVDGTPYEHLTPQLARELGIAVIYQEFTLISTLSAAENVFLGDFIRKGPVLDRKAMAARAESVFTRLGVTISPSALVETLTTGYQQIVEIAKALSRHARLLIMDEPSAPLTSSEVEAMFTIVDALKREGMTIIYISHRMDEIFRLSDRVSVLRDGAYVATLETAVTSRQELIALMVGRELGENYPERTHELGATSITVENLSGNGIRDISFDARKGEILGFAGLIGAGRTELMELLFGAKRIEAGKISIHGKQAISRTPIQAIRQGIALVPEDRKRHGLVLEFSIAQNISLPSLEKLSRAKVVSPTREAALATKYMQDLRIKAPNSNEIVGNLSGGNQQKVVLAKWLATDPDVLIFDEPTRGIDIGARHEIYALMRRLAAAGKTILMVSSDMEELIGMSDRVIVLQEGHQRGTLAKENITQEAILSLASEGEVG